MTTTELVERCHAARMDGMDFPTMWHEILKPSCLVVGSPTQAIRCEQLRLEIQLLSGGRIVFDTTTGDIWID